MLPGDREKNDQIQNNFPLFIKGEFDFFFQNSPWPLGLSSSMPSNLKRNIAAAIATDFLGNASVDYTLKKYLRGVEYPEENEDRLDKMIRRHIDSCSDLIANAVSVLSHEPECAAGEVVALWTLSRAKFSVEIAAYSAQRGALFECIAVQRMIVEQLAWASKIVDFQDGEDLFRVKPQECIGYLSKRVPSFGRLYGWLSKHAHWYAEGHAKALVSSGDKVGHLFASSYFKAMSFLLILVVLDHLLHFIKDRFPHDLELRGMFRHYSADAMAEARSVLRRFPDDIVSLDEADGEFLGLRALLPPMEAP